MPAVSVSLLYFWQTSFLRLQFLSPLCHSRHPSDRLRAQAFILALCGGPRQRLGVGEGRQRQRQTGKVRYYNPFHLSGPWLPRGLKALLAGSLCHQVLKEGKLCSCYPPCKGFRRTKSGHQNSSREKRERKPPCIFKVPTIMKKKQHSVIWKFATYLYNPVEILNFSMMKWLECDIFIRKK